MGYQYLATPYSGYEDGIEAAFIAACKIAAKLLKQGIIVYSPIAATHYIAIHGGIDPLAHELWMAVDRPMMDAADGLIVAQMPGWRESRGIKEEIEIFLAAGKPVVYLLPPDIGDCL